jgi:hypothetical protein
VHGGEGECLGSRGGELRGGVARGDQRAQASPVGDARGGGGGVRPAAMGVWGCGQREFARGTRGNRIIGLGRAVERPRGGPDVKDGAAVRCAAW